jgi:hypothetical protein
MGARPCRSGLRVAARLLGRHSAWRNRLLASRRQAVKGRRHNLKAKSGQIKARKTQTNPRKKAWIALDSFGRFGVFQGVTRNSNKKYLPNRSSRLRLCPILSTPRTLAASQSADLEKLYHRHDISSNQKSYSRRSAARSSGDRESHWVVLPMDAG